MMWVQVASICSSLATLNRIEFILASFFVKNFGKICAKKWMDAKEAM